MRRHFARQGWAAAIALAATAALTGAATATALPSSSHELPTGGKHVTRCHTTLFKVGGRLPVHTAFAIERGKHPAKKLLSCSNANAVAKAGARYYKRYPFGLGKKIHVKGVTYTMGRTVGMGGEPTSSFIYGWAGDGVVIYLINPTGA